MKISTKLQGSALLTIGIVFIFVVAVLYTSIKAGQAGQRNQIAQKILETSVTGVALRIEYGLTGEDRPKVQWYALQTTFNNILDQAAPLFTEPTNKTLYTAISDNQERKKVIFNAVVSAIERGDNPELGVRLNSQLAVTVQEGVGIATRLAELSREEHSAFHKTLNVIVGVLGLFAILFALIYYFVSRRISFSLMTLQQEFTRIASLDFSSTTTTTTTTTGSNDEIGQLARAFNKMVEKLKGSYGSLEKKVTERTTGLAEKTKEAENSQKATLNVLEDLNSERIKLQAVKSKDEAILASIGDGLVAVDKEGKILTANKAFENLVGWKVKEVLGKLLVEVVQREDEAGNIVPFKERILNKILSTTIATTTATDWYYIRKDKTRFLAASIITPVILDGKIIGAVEVFRDITKEKDVDKAKTEFVSLASHQLRTPLTDVSWHIEMILMGDLGTVIPKQKKYLEAIYQGNTRMIELVNTLLNVSRLELGTFKVEPKPTDVIALVRSVLDEQKPKIKKKKLIMVENLSKDIPTFSADPKLLRMVFQNLLANSVEYISDKGTVHFEVAFDTMKKNILLTVADTGYGIPKNQQDKIFTKFFRADNVRDKDTDGTGLGLYIIKSIVETSKGKEEIQGTTFYVTLPLEGMRKNEGTKSLT